MVQGSGALLFLNLTISLQAQSSPSLNVFPFDIKDYIEEREIGCSAPDTHQEEHVLSSVTRDRLQLMLPHLEKGIANLACNAKPLYDIFLAIREELSQDLLVVLSPTAFIKGHAPRVIIAK